MHPAIRMRRNEHVQDGGSVDENHAGSYTNEDRGFMDVARRVTQVRDSGLT